MTPRTLEIIVSRHVTAPAERIYAVVSDVPNLARHSPENISSEWIDAGDRAVVRRRFRGTNLVGVTDEPRYCVPG